MNITIREACIDDYDQINVLFTDELIYHIAIKPQMFQMAEPVMTLQWFKDQLAYKQSVLYVAELDSALIGLIQLLLRQNPDDPIFVERRYVHIEELYVAEPYRGRGVGRSLMETAKAWATKQGATSMDLWVWSENKSAITFYQNLGYRQVRQVWQIELP